MASLSDITVKRELRPCLVNGHKALFHTWEHWELDDVKKVFGLIEDEKGQVVRVNPTSIKFMDKKINEYYFGGVKKTSVEDFLYEYLCKDCSNCTNCYENGRQRECERYNEDYKWLTKGSSQEVE